jgi:predicted AAA+ superfamily ATPase
MINKDLIEDFFLKERKWTGIEREIKIPTEINKVVSIIGPRRSGKTWYFYFLLNILKNPMYVSFDDIAFRNIKIEEFFEVIKTTRNLNIHQQLYLSMRCKQ